MTIIPIDDWHERVLRARIREKVSEIRREVEELTREADEPGFAMPRMAHLDVLRSVHPTFARYARRRRKIELDRTYEEARAIAMRESAREWKELQRQRRDAERKRRCGWFWRLFVGT